MKSAPREGEKTWITCI